MFKLATTTHKRTTPLGYVNDVLDTNGVAGVVPVICAFATHTAKVVNANKWVKNPAMLVGRGDEQRTTQPTKLYMSAYSPILGVSATAYFRLRATTFVPHASPTLVTPTHVHECGYRQSYNMFSFYLRQGANGNYGRVSHLFLGFLGSGDRRLQISCLFFHQSFQVTLW